MTIGASQQITSFADKHRMEMAYTRQEDNAGVVLMGMLPL